MGVADTLIPTKFIFIITHLLSTIVILSANQQNIYATLGSKVNVASDAYDGAHSGIVAACVITIIFLAFELIFLFLGYTLFYDRLNLFQCIMHALATLTYAWYNLDSWQWYTIWYLFGFLTVIPFLVELSATGVAFLYYRKLAT